MSIDPSTREPLTVLGIVASPRSGGSTLSAVRAVLDGAQEAGAGVQLVDLAATPVDEVVRAVESADAVVFGSPTYRASHTSLLAGFLEKVEHGAAWETSAPLKGKATAIVMTGAASEHFLAPERLRATLASFFATQVLSPSLYLQPSAFREDRSLTASTRDLVELHGRALVDLARACRASKYIGELTPLV
jgi:FMN reductase